MSRTALVAGASGLVGGHVLRLLLADPSYERVTIFVRRELPVSNRKLAQRVLEFDRLTELGDFPRVHDVFCCLVTTIAQAGSQAAFRRVDFTYVVELARAASRHRADQFLLVSAVGAAARSRVFYNRVKGETEDAVQRVSFAGIHIFRPSLLLGARTDPRPAERAASLVARALSWTLIGPLKRYRPIRAEIVAQAMVRRAREASRGLHVYESDGMGLP